MIYLFSGTPGSGKSLHTAEIISNTLSSGKPIIGNFEIDKKAIEKKKGTYTYMPNWELTPDKLITFASEFWQGKKVKEEYITLIIDECQLIFNAREWNAKGRNEWLAFYTQHRKFGFRIILVAQFDRMIDRQIRSLIEYEYIHRKVGNYGSMGKFLSLFAFGKLFVCVKMWYPMKERVGSEFFMAKKKYYSLYDTYNTFASDEQIGD